MSDGGLVILGFFGVMLFALLLLTHMHIVDTYIAPTINEATGTDIIEWNIGERGIVRAGKIIVYVVFAIPLVIAVWLLYGNGRDGIEWLVGKRTE